MYLTAFRLKHHNYPFIKQKTKKKSNLFVHQILWHRFMKSRWMFLCCVVYPETTRNFIYAIIAPCSNMSVTNSIIGKPPKQMQYCNDNQLQIKPSKYVKIVCIPWRELSFLTLYVMVEGLFKCCYTGRHFFLCMFPFLFGVCCLRES